MSRVVVVGGGFGGAASAARLAKLGHSVTLVERRDRLGGAIGFVERDGFRWDAGPTATALPAVLRDLFRKTGRPLDRELALEPLDPMREHRFGDGTRLLLPSGGRAEHLEAVEAALGRGLGRAWVDYVHGFAEGWDLLRRACLEHPWSREHADPRARALLRSRRTLHQEAARALGDARLRELALFPARLDGQDPRRMPAWTGMWAYVEQSFGLWTVPGGLGALAAAMSRRLAERRVSVLLGTTVRDLRLHGSRVVGVETDAGALDADTVVCAIAPGSLPALARHARRSRSVPPPAVWHLGLAADAPDLPQELVLHGDPMLVVRTGGRAPEGGAAWTVLARGAPSEDVVETLARRGIDVHGRVRVRVERAPRDQVHDLAGSPYGVLWRGRGTLTRKLAVPPYDGLHLVGAHAAAGAGLPLVGLSAAVAAERVGKV